MKTEYLNRTATFTAKNLDNLFTEVGGKIVMRNDVDLVDTMTIACAANVMSEAMNFEMFNGSKEAITLRGEDFAVKTDTALRRIKRASLESHDKRDDEADLDRVLMLLGACVLVGLDVEDKLFDSDHVKEESND